MMNENEEIRGERRRLMQLPFEHLRCCSATHGLDPSRLSHPIAICDTDVNYIKAFGFSDTACDDLMGATHSSVVQYIAVRARVRVSVMGIQSTPMKHMCNFTHWIQVIVVLGENGSDSTYGNEGSGGARGTCT